MFTADLLHDETAEIARLAEQVTALQSELEDLRTQNIRLQQDATGHTVREQVRGQVWEWFRTGGPDDEATREQAVRQVCDQFLSLGNVEPGLVTAAAVALVESCPSGLSDAQVVAAAAACRQVITFAELTQAALTRELAWRYETRHDAAQVLDLDPDVDGDFEGGSDAEGDGRRRVPDWVRAPSTRRAGAFRWLRGASFCLLRSRPRLSSMFMIASQSSLTTAVSLGKCPRFLMILQSW